MFEIKRFINGAPLAESAPEAVDALAEIMEIMDSLPGYSERGWCAAFEIKLTVFEVADDDV